MMTFKDAYRYQLQILSEDCILIQHAVLGGKELEYNNLYLLRQHMQKLEQLVRESEGNTEGSL